MTLQPLGNGRAAQDADERRRDQREAVDADTLRAARIRVLMARVDFCRGMLRLAAEDLRRELSE